MANPSRSQRDTLVGVAVGVLVLLGLYGVYTFVFAPDPAPPVPSTADQAKPQKQAPKKAAARPTLPPSGKMSHPPKGASGGAGGGPGGSFQVIGDGEGSETIRSSNPFASGGAGKRVGSGGGSAGGQF